MLRVVVVELDQLSGTTFLHFQGRKNSSQLRQSPATKVSQDKRPPNRHCKYSIFSRQTGPAIQEIQTSAVHKRNNRQWLQEQLINEFRTAMGGKEHPTNKNPASPHYHIRRPARDRHTLPTSNHQRHHISKSKLGPAVRYDSPEPKPIVHPPPNRSPCLRTCPPLGATTRCNTRCE